MTSEIVRMYGQADDHDIVFLKKEGKWQVMVPADMQDGQYVVEIFAQALNGSQVYWSGILYMSQGVPILSIQPNRTTLRQIDKQTVLTQTDHHAVLSRLHKQMVLRQIDNQTILIFRRCRCG